MTTPEQPPSNPVSSPAGPQSPGPGPQSPGAGPQSPGGGVTAPPAGGGMPPGGWQSPMPAAQSRSAPLAGFGARVIAAIVDAIVIAIPAGIIIGALGIGAAASGNEGSDVGVVAALAGLFVSLLVLVVIGFLYAPVLMARGGRHNGQTLGKQITGIRVVRTSGQPVTFGTGVLREVVIKGIGGAVLSSTGIGILVVLLNYVWPLWDDRNRALHDMAASTLVVKA